MTQEEFLKRYTYSVSQDRIGGGGFGTVYKAKDNVLHRYVAIKVSEVKTTADGKKTFSLKDEFEALSHVPRHPNIANYEKFYSFEMPVGIFDYAVMQYYPDGNLGKAIKEGLSDEQKVEVAVGLLEGIAFLHDHKVVHRDLKPGNILVSREGDRVIPVITDFGLSKAADTGDGSQFSNSFGAGTQRYSSPEQLQGKPLRFNTDLWSYGAIVYELFTGEQLFSPGSGAANSAQAELEVYNKIIRGDVQNLAKMPERWRKVTQRCMVVNPDKRVKTAEELLELLSDYSIHKKQEHQFAVQKHGNSPKPQMAVYKGIDKVNAKTKKRNWLTHILLSLMTFLLFEWINWYLSNGHKEQLIKSLFVSLQVFGMGGLLVLWFYKLNKVRKRFSWVIAIGSLLLVVLFVILQIVIFNIQKHRMEFNSTYHFIDDLIIQLYLLCMLMALATLFVIFPKKKKGFAYLVLNLMFLIYGITMDDSDCYPLVFMIIVALPIITLFVYQIEQRKKGINENGKKDVELNISDEMTVPDDCALRNDNWKTNWATTENTIENLP